MDKEEIQVWILIATYESMRTFHRSAWMSAGRAFRLVQLMRLHEIDIPTKPPTPGLDLIDTEEKRRVFWMAYFLDHLLSMRDNWPITLNEHVVSGIILNLTMRRNDIWFKSDLLDYDQICTRLPGPDADFQSGQPVLGALLSEAITDILPQDSSPFNECVILATICGRSLFQEQQCNIRFAYGDSAANQMGQDQWLDNILTNRLSIISRNYPSPIQICDPLLLFAHIMAHASVIHLYKGIKSVVWTVDMEDRLLEYQGRAFNAARDIVTLAKGLEELNLFKVCLTVLNQLPLHHSYCGSADEKMGRFILLCPFHCCSVLNFYTVIVAQIKHCSHYLTSFC